MRTLWKVTLGLTAAATIGTAVFIFSRPAAAAAAGKKALKISADCLSVEIVSEEDGRAALEAAAIAAFRSMEERADLYIVRAIALATSCPVSDAMRISGIPGVPFGVTVAQIKAIVGDRTVEQVAELAAQGGLPGIPGLEGAATPQRNPINAVLGWVTGGDYP